MSTPSTIAYSVNLMSDLVGLTGGATDETILLLGYYQLNDGGGGEFYWDPASVAPRDGGAVVQPTGVTGAGRWLRIITDNTVNVRFFGAVGDSTTNDLTAINNARDYCVTKTYILAFDNGSYYISDTFTVSSVSNFNIQFNETTIRTNFPTSKLSPMVSIDHVTGFSMTGQLSFQADTTDATNTQTDGLVVTACSEFYIDTIKIYKARFGVVLGDCADGILDNVEGYDNQGYQSTASDSGSVMNIYSCTNLRIKQIMGSGCWGPAIWLSNDLSGVDNKEIQIDGAAIQLSTTSNIAIGIEIRSCVNLQVGNLQVAGGISALYAELNSSNQILDIHFDSVIATNCTVSSTIANAIRIASVVSGTVENFKIDKVSIDGGRQPSIFILRANDVAIGSSTITNIPSNGVYIENSNQIFFDYINILSCQTHGILTGSTASSNLYINNYYFEDIGSGCNGIHVANNSLASCYINYITGKYNLVQHLYCFSYGAPISTDQLQISNIVNIGGLGGAAYYRATPFPAVRNSFFCNTAAPTSGAANWNASDFILSTNAGPASEYGFRCITSGAPGTWVKIDQGLTSGSSLQSGNGSSVSFNIAHGLGVTPTCIQVQAGSSASANIQYTDADATNITVHYTTAPASGSNNLIFYWEARV